MSELKPCPFCGGEASLFTTDEIGYIGDEHFTVKCNGCFCGTGHYADPERAIEAWNRCAHPFNDPLTLEQLRKMDREPVWIPIPDGSGYGDWAIVDIGAQTELLKAVGLDAAHEECNYGKTWIAYRHKPEGSTTP
jgi:Lar family restriction alleviation protein